AKVRQGSANAAPLLTTGSLSIQVLHGFKTACQQFFVNKNIEGGDQVGKVMYNFEAVSTQSWVSANKDRLLALMFKEFMAEFKGKFLACSWEDELIQDQIAIQGNSAFLTWINMVCNANDELAAQGSVYYIIPANFHCHIVPHLNPDAIINLEEWMEWMERVCHLEEDLNLQHGQWIAETAKKAKTSTIASAAINTTALATVKALSSTANIVPLPWLTDKEKNLLTIHRGCYKCRVYYAGHMLQDCPVFRASLEACKGVTSVNTVRAKATFEHNMNTQTAMHVGAVFRDSDKEDYFQDVLSDNEGNECISSILHLSSHLKWTCCIDMPLTCALTPINALIDHGCSLRLNTSVGHSQVPVDLSMAFGGHEYSYKYLCMNQSTIHLVSPDTIWKARIMNTIICPQLHTNLILGLDFLVRNHIMVDAKEWMTVAKYSVYDLLNP
ncbi:hypothetical protein L208DRAFT_1056146, partial [Tricholoma matsutake]